MNNINKVSETFGLVRSLAALGLTALMTLDSARANPNNSTGTAQQLPLNVYSGAFQIGVPGENDYYSFYFTDWGKFTVQSEGSTDTYGFLLDANGRYVYVDNNSADPNFKMTDVKVHPGTYYLRVKHYLTSGTGRYYLRNSFTPAPPDDHGNTMASATAIDSVSHRGTRVTGSIERGGDVDWFRVYVNGNSFTSTALPYVLFTAISTGTTTLVARLYDSTGQELAWNDRSLGSVNFSVAVNPPGGSGTYYLKVQHWDPNIGTGDYGLTLWVYGDDHRATMGGTTSSVWLNYNTATVAGGIQLPGDTDMFRINVSGGGFLTATSTGTTDVVGRLYDSTGRELMMNDDLGDGMRNFSVRVAVTDDTYFLKVEHYTTDVGAYGVNFRQER